MRSLVLHLLRPPARQKWQRSKRQMRTWSRSGRWRNQSKVARGNRNECDLSRESWSCLLIEIWKMKDAWRWTASNIYRVVSIVNLSSPPLLVRLKLYNSKVPTKGLVPFSTLELMWRKSRLISSPINASMTTSSIQERWMSVDKISQPCFTYVTISISYGSFWSANAKTTDGSWIEGVSTFLSALPVKWFGKTQPFEEGTYGHWFYLAIVCLGASSWSD